VYALKLTITAVSDPDYPLRNARNPGAENYSAYLASGLEPAGVWAGSGLAALGIGAGTLVDHDVMRALYGEGRLAPSGVQAGNGASVTYRLHAEQAGQLLEAMINAQRLDRAADAEQIEAIRLALLMKQRKSVAAWDLTFSVPKSVSIVYAAYKSAAAKARRDGDDDGAAEAEARAAEIEAIVMGTVTEVIALIEQDVRTRTGQAGREIRDTRGLVAALFLHHESRECEPQLHVHSSILNAAQVADYGDDRFRALDGDSIITMGPHWQGVGSDAIASKLAAAGYTMTPSEDGLAHEIAGISKAAREALSTRTGRLTGQARQWAGRFREVRGREPTAKELRIISQQATLYTRKAKEAPPSPAEQLAKWELKYLAAVHQALADVPAAVRNPQDVPHITQQSRAAVIEMGIASVQRQRAAWKWPHLSHEIGRYLSAVTPGLSAADHDALRRDLVREALQSPSVMLLTPPPLADMPEALRRRSDGGSIFNRGSQSHKYATTAHLNMEDRILLRAARPAAFRPDERTVREALAAERGLSADQRAAAEGMLLNRAAVSLLQAGAGTGKSTTMGAVSRVWEQVSEGTTIGLAVSTNAARNLQQAGVARTHNTADFLGALDPARADKPVTASPGRCDCLHDGTRGHLRVGRGDRLVVDEAATLSTAQLDVITEIAGRHGAVVDMVGDKAQNTAVEAGGMFPLLQDRRPEATFTLSEVHRMKADWEKAASVRLAAGDKSVYREYERRGRIYSGSGQEMNALAVRHWAGDWLRTSQDAVLITHSNEQAAQLSRMARDLLIDRGLLPDRADVTLADGNEAAVGDVVRARHNEKIDAAGQPLSNRDELRIEGWRQAADGGREAIVRRRIEDRAGGWTRTFPVPESYLKDDSELAYSRNDTVVQGRTAKAGRLVPGQAQLDRKAFHVGMTRGSELNAVYLDVTRGGERLNREPGHAPAPGREKPPPQVTSPEALFASYLERDGDELSATATIEAEQEEATSLPRLVGQWSAIVRMEHQARIENVLRQELSEYEYRRMENDPERPILNNLLHAAQAAGMDSEEIARRAVQQRDLAQVRSVAAVLHGRVSKITGPVSPSAPASYEAATPRMADPEMERAARETAQLADAKIAGLGEQLAADPPAWTAERLGPVPDGSLERAEWTGKAARVETARQLTGWTDPEQALGPLPDKTCTEVIAAHRAAPEALGLSRAERDRLAATDGELRARVAEGERARAHLPARADERLRGYGYAIQENRSAAALEAAAGNHDAAARLQDRAERDAVQYARAEADAAARQAALDATETQRTEARLSALELERRGAIASPGPVCPQEPSADILARGPQPGTAEYSALITAWTREEQDWQPAGTAAPPPAPERMPHIEALSAHVGAAAAQPPPLPAAEPQAGEPQPQAAAAGTEDIDAVLAGLSARWAEIEASGGRGRPQRVTEPPEPARDAEPAGPDAAATHDRAAQPDAEAAAQQEAGLVTPAGDVVRAEITSPVPVTPDDHDVTTPPAGVTETVTPEPAGEAEPVTAAADPVSEAEVSEPAAAYENATGIEAEPDTPVRDPKTGIEAEAAAQVPEPAIATGPATGPSVSEPGPEVLDGAPQERYAELAAARQEREAAIVAALEKEPEPGPEAEAPPEAEAEAEAGEPEREAEPELPGGDGGRLADLAISDDHGYEADADPEPDYGPALADEPEPEADYSYGYDTAGTDYSYGYDTPEADYGYELGG